MWWFLSHVCSSAKLRMNEYEYEIWTWPNWPILNSKLLLWRLTWRWCFYRNCFNYKIKIVEYLWLYTHEFHIDIGTWRIKRLWSHFNHIILQPDYEMQRITKQIIFLINSKYIVLWIIFYNNDKKGRALSFGLNGHRRLELITDVSLARGASFFRSVPSLMLVENWHALDRRSFLHLDGSGKERSELHSSWVVSGERAFFFKLQ